MHVVVQHYFAYGSNMDVTRVRARGMRFIDARGGRLSGYQLLFDKMGREHAGSGHANIAPSPGQPGQPVQNVEGVLYGLMTPDEICIMDAFERTPINYSREVVTVETREGHVSAWTYVANPAVRHPDCRPERSYLAHLLAGAPFLSAAYVAELAAIEVLDG